MTVSEEFDWRQFPDTQRWVAQWVKEIVDAVPFLATLQARMRIETGTQLQDWVDHLALDLQPWKQNPVCWQGMRSSYQSELIAIRPVWTSV